MVQGVQGVPLYSHTVYKNQLATIYQSLMQSRTHLLNSFNSKAHTKRTIKDVL